MGGRGDRRVNPLVLYHKLGDKSWDFSWDKLEAKFINSTTIDERETCHLLEIAHLS